MPAGNVEAPDEGSLDLRDDIRLAKKSLKLLRSLCREYGLSFHLPEGSSFGAHRARHQAGQGQRRGKGRGKGSAYSGQPAAAAPPAQTSKATAKANKEESSSSSSSGSSDFEFSSEEEKDGLSKRAEWPEVQRLLGKLQTAKRVKAMKEIHLSLDASAAMARDDLVELEELDKMNPSFDRRGDGGGDPSETAVVSKELLDFDTTQMPVVQALRRCISVVPELRRRAHEKAEAKRQAQLLLEQQERERKQREEELAAELEDTGLVGEIERKFRAMGALPANCDPDLRLVFEAQRTEARALALGVQDAEREVLIKRLCLEYVEGKTEGNPDQELLRAAIEMAQEMKAAMSTEKRAAMELQLQEDKLLKNVPTEEDVTAAIEEQRRLEGETERMQDHISHMRAQMQTHSQAPAPAEGAGESGPRLQRRGAVQQATLLDGAVTSLAVPLHQVDEIYPRLQRESQVIIDKISEQDQAVAQAEALLKTAQTTLMTLEECKILFLERVAKERPALIDDIISKAAALADGPDEFSSSSSEDEEPGDKEPPDKSDKGPEAAAEAAEPTREPAGEGEDLANPLLSLGAEESWLRMQLEQTLDPEADDDDGSDHSSEHRRVREAAEVADNLARDLWKLVRRVESESAAVSGGGEADGAAAEAVEDAAAGAEASAGVPDWTTSEMTREEAARALRQLPHEDVRALLRLRAENAQLELKIKQAQRDVDRLRGKCGATETLLGSLGVPGVQRYTAEAAQDAPSPELVSEVKRKARDLQILRWRWWSERQDPSVTVRRALATRGLPEAADVEDAPPSDMQASLFDRIWLTMTAP